MSGTVRGWIMKRTDSRQLESVCFGPTNSGLRLTAIDPRRTLIQSSVVSTGLIAGKPAPTGISPAFRHALYLWEPRLPAMGREAAPVTDVRFGSKAVIPTGSFRPIADTEALC